MKSTRSTLPNEVFLSHSSRNKGFVTKLATVLRRHNVPVWLSETNLAGAQQWHDEIGQALKRCDWFLVVLSPSSVKSEWVKRELLFALQQKQYQGRIVPVLHKNCDVLQLSWTLPSLQYVSFLQDFDDGCRDLLRIWGLGYAG